MIGELGAARSAAIDAPPNVIVVVLDCVRADHVGAYGYERDTTRSIDRLAVDSVLFQNAVSQSNWTRPSVASLFTSLYPSQHQVPGAGLSGDEIAAQREARGVLDVNWILGGWAPDSGRFFAYLHLLQLHFPYAPGGRDDVYRTTNELLPTDREGRRPRDILDRKSLGPEHRDELMALYDGELRSVDRNVGRLIASLRSLELYEDSLIVLTSDHGEQFQERGGYLHGGNTLYAELTRVPLLIKFPGSAEAGTVVLEPAGLIDILPTLFDVAGASIPPDISGRSLLPLINDPAARAPPRLSEPTTHATHKAMLFEGRKYIIDLTTGRLEAYDLAADPGDQHDIAAQLSEQERARVRRVLSDILDANRRFAARHVPDSVDMRDAEVERLRALGYIR